MCDGTDEELDNLILLCRRRHRLVHEAGFRLQREAGRFRFLKPDGSVSPAVPAAAVPDAAGWLQLKRDHELRDIAIDARTNMPSWRGERMDYSWAVAALQRRAVVQEAGAGSDARSGFS